MWSLSRQQPLKVTTPTLPRFPNGSRSYLAAGVYDRHRRSPIRTFPRSRPIVVPRNPDTFWGTFSGGWWYKAVPLFPSLGLTLHALIGTVKCLFGYHTGPWHYEDLADCTQTCDCNRYGPRARRIEHQWGEFVQEDVCTTYRACARCATLDIRHNHDWEFIDDHDDPADRMCRCLRCGAEEEEPYYL